ncbi:hypothetical protein M9458_015288, partial [Cirrhinus mrigala]
MKAKAQRKSKGKAGKQTPKDKLKKFKDSLDNFVKSKSGFDENESDQRGIFVKRKSRKELRKEKRKLKKAKKKSHYMGQSLQNPSEEPSPNTPAAKDEKTQKSSLKPTGNLKNAAQRQQKTNKDNVNTKDGEEDTTKKKVRFSEDLPKQKKKSSQNESRKRALLEANVEEDKEIKRLEKRLGLNKRKNKKSLPQSFTYDGLDYILGILEPGASANGLYESDEEMDIDKAKDDFDELDEDSEGQMTDDENKDESEVEGDSDEEEGDGEDDAQMEEEEDVEDDTQIEEEEDVDDTQIEDEEDVDDTQIEDEVEGDEEEEDTDASEENDDEEKDSEQKTP